MAETVQAVRKAFRRVPGAVWGLLALAAGMTLGSLFPAPLSPIASGVAAGFGFLAKAAPYIIFFTIAAAIIDMMRHGKAGRFALWVSIVFTALGLAAGLLAALLTVPLLNLQWGFDASGFDMSAGEMALAVPLFLLAVVLGLAAFPFILVDHLLPFVTVPWHVVPGGAFSETIVEHLFEVARSTPSFIAVFWAIGWAIILSFGARWRGTAWFATPTMDVIRAVGVDGMRLVGRGLKAAFPFLLLGIGIYVPSAITSAIDRSSARLGAAAKLDTTFGSSPLSLYLTALWVQIIVLAVFMAILVAIVCWMARFPIRAFLRDYFAWVYPFAWGTSSSAASIPINLERTGSGLKVRKEIREFVIPLGATVNLDGAIMACFVISAMAAIIVGYRPTFVDLLLLLIPIKLVTLGVPGIPGGIAAVVPPVAAGILPLPEGSEATFIAIWYAFSVGLSDQFRTGVNTTTNGVVSLGFEAIYDRFFSKEDAAPETPASEVASVADEASA